MSETKTLEDEPFFFVKPTILVTGIKNFNDFFPTGKTTAQCINRIMRLTIIIVLLLAVGLRSWWPIITVGGLIILALLISYGYQAYSRSQDRKALARQLVAENIESKADEPLEESATLPEPITNNISNSVLGDSRPPQIVFSENQPEKEKDFVFDTDGIVTASNEEFVSDSEISDFQVDLLPEEELFDSIRDDCDPQAMGCEPSDRFEQIVIEQARKRQQEYGCRDAIVTKLEQCAPFNPTDTIPQPSLPRAITVEGQMSNCAADREEQARRQAIAHANPSTGRVSSMLGLNVENVSVANLPDSYRKSSLNTSIDQIYSNGQQRGVGGTMQRMTQAETGTRRATPTARPVHDPTETMIHSMYQDSTEQTWKTQFLDRRPPSWLNPADPSSRRLEEQAAASRSAYRAMNWNNGP